MKGLSIGNIQRGVSTLEILIASSVLTLVLSATAMVIYGNQYAGLAAQTSQQALAQAQAHIEDVRAVSRVDAALVVATTSVESHDGMLFVKSLTVSQIDLFKKLVTSTVSWVQLGNTRSISLSTILADRAHAAAGDTCSSVLVGDWNAAQLTPPLEISGSAGGTPVTSVTAFSKKVYVTTNNAQGHTTDLYLFGITTPTTPTPLSSIDANTTTPGLGGVAIASTTSAVYAYVANAHSSNWGICSLGPSCAQIQVVDVTAPASPSVIKNIKIPATSTPFVLGSGGQGVGNTITHNGGYIYVGLSKTASGPEFVIYDVGGGLGSPTNPLYVGSYAVGRGVNRILVRNGYAYLATSDNAREVLVLNVSVPSAPTAVGLFDAPGSTGFGAGKSLALVGTKLYLGRNYVNNAPEFYVLDVSNPETSLPIVTSIDLGTVADPESVVGLVARSDLVFVVMTRFVKIYKITANSTTLVKSFDISSDNVVGTAVGCEGNYVYVGGYKTSSSKGVLYTLYPGP